MTDTELHIGGTTVISPFDYLSFDAQATGYQPVYAEAMALCTSGTTSTPKVYVYNEQAVCDQVLLGDYVYKENRDIVHDGTIKHLAFLPFHHIFGFMAVYMWYSFFRQNHGVYRKPDSGCDLKRMPYASGHPYICGTAALEQCGQKRDAQSEAAGRKNI